MSKTTATRCRIASMAAVAAAMLHSGPACASEVERGRVLGERLCASCHMGEGQGEKQGPMGIPSFRAVADRPGQTIEGIMRWLLSRPTMMPDHHLSRDEAAALALYIDSLRRAP